MHHTPGPGDTHVYLLLYNIPADARKLEKNAKNLGTFGVNTVNDKPEYTPPCSKGPGEKKYTLTIYALSDTLKFNKPDVTLDMLLAAMKDKTLGTSAINVTYERMGQGDGEHHGPPRGGPPELQRAIEGLKLTPEQQAKVDTAVQQFREKQEAAKSELLKQLKGVLSADQFEKVESSFKRPPPPPPPSAPHEAR
jgi:hypothetical protein